MSNTSRARTGESFVCHVMWTDELGRALDVEDVSMTLYAFSGADREVLLDNVGMTVTDEAHIFSLSIIIPQGYSGHTLQALYACTLKSDSSKLYKETTLWIDNPLSVQNIKVGFV